MKIETRKLNSEQQKALSYSNSDLNQLTTQKGSSYALIQRNARPGTEYYFNGGVSYSSEAVIGPAPNALEEIHEPAPYTFKMSNNLTIAHSLPTSLKDPEQEQAGEPGKEVFLGKVKIYQTLPGVSDENTARFYTNTYTNTKHSGDSRPYALVIGRNGTTRIDRSEHTLAA